MAMTDEWRAQVSAVALSLTEHRRHLYAELLAPYLAFQNAERELCKYRKSSAHEEDDERERDLEVKRDLAVEWFKKMARAM